MHILEIQLLTHDLAGQRDFYTDVLQVPLLETSLDTVTFQAGHSRLAFKQAPPGWSGCYHYAFNIPENQFGQAKAWLSQRVALIADSNGADEFDFQNWNAHAVYCYDPAGNVVELIARHKLANAAHESFGGHSLLCVSEIGLPAVDVRDVVRSLTSGLELEVYWGAGSDTFTALGDEHGLFIVVKRGRIWFPDTGKGADAQPLRIMVSKDLVPCT